MTVVVPLPMFMYSNCRCIVVPLPMYMYSNCCCIVVPLPMYMYSNCRCIFVMVGFVFSSDRPSPLLPGLPLPNRHHERHHAPLLTGPLWLLLVLQLLSPLLQ